VCSDHLCLGSVSCIDSEILKIIIVKYVICYHNHVLFLFWQVMFGICVQLLKWKKKRLRLYGNLIFINLFNQKNNHWGLSVTFREIGFLQVFQFSQPKNLDYCWILVQIGVISISESIQLTEPKHKWSLHT
jgi:hypothetical protein